MIRVICPNCQSKLDAKDELAGQTRKCPRCGQPVVIASDEPASASAEPLAPAVSSSPAADSASSTIQAALDYPDQLGRLNHYLICGRDKLVATWKNDGRGWMLKSGAGFVSAKRNNDKLPSQGTFTLVELEIRTHDGGHELVAITSYRLAERWALPALAQRDDKILSKISGPGALNREQKTAVMAYLREHFMAEVWHRVPEIVEYLTNADYHSHRVGR